MSTQPGASPVDSEAGCAASCRVHVVTVASNAASTPAYRKWSYGQPEPFVQMVEVDPQPVQFTGDVVVLTSPITASPAEVFALAATEVAHATVIGNPLFGEFSDAIDWVLPNGIEFTMSMEIYTDLEGTRRPHHSSPCWRAACTAALRPSTASLR